jgi:hypothetical protein
MLEKGEAAPSNRRNSSTELPGVCYNFFGLPMQCSAKEEAQLRERNVWGSQTADQHTNVQVACLEVSAFNYPHTHYTCFVSCRLGGSSGTSRCHGYGGANGQCCGTPEVQVPHRSDLGAPRLFIQPFMSASIVSNSAVRWPSGSSCDGVQPSSPWMHFGQSWYDNRWYTYREHPHDDFTNSLAQRLYMSFAMRAT